MSLQAYQAAQRTTESPRETEYRLFGQVTGALMDARDRERNDPRVIFALNWNRRLWSTLAADCTAGDNGLPDPTKAQIISLSIWVNKYSSSVMRERADIEPLIDINKTIMEGLALRPGD